MAGSLYPENGSDVAEKCFIDPQIHGENQMT